MSFSLDIEIDVRADKGCVLGILQDMHFLVYEEDMGSIRGNFPESNMYAIVRWVADEGQVAPRTEGADFAKNWKIGVRASFYYVIGEYEKCSLEMHKFLEMIDKRTEAFFILSFQMEEVYAIKDDSGVRIVGEF
ncbi:hypothetical protein [Ralstonia flaminis]|nr:hypothetical protein [Ralstonia sp. LMG 18101]